MKKLFILNEIIILFLFIELKNIYTFFFKFTNFINKSLFINK